MIDSWSSGVSFSRLSTRVTCVGLTFNRRDSSALDLTSPVASKCCQLRANRIGFRRGFRAELDGEPWYTDCGNSKLIQTNVLGAGLGGEPTLPTLHLGRFSAIQVSILNPGQPTGLE